MVEDQMCRVCSGNTKPGEKQDAVSLAMDVRYSDCIVIPGVKGPCLRCIWRYGKHCEHAHKAYQVPVPSSPRENKPTSRELAWASQDQAGQSGEDDVVREFLARYRS